jgi:hypothetical protein
MTDHQTSPELVPTDAAPITEITEELAKPDALAPVKPDSPTFAELGARPETVEALAASGIHRSFAIQEYALPIAIRGPDRPTHSSAVSRSSSARPAVFSISRRASSSRWPASARSSWTKQTECSISVSSRTSRS